MGVNIKGFNAKGDMVGDIVPEYIPKSLKEDMAIEREINSHTDGYSPDRSMRKIASIDQAVLYNYAMLKGIKPEKHAEYWAIDNGKNLIRFIEEFPAFKLVENPL
jgi:hypothetical protein